MKSVYLRGFAAVLLTTIGVSSVSAIDLLGLATVNEENKSGVLDVEIGGSSALSADVLSGSSGSPAASATVSTDNGLGVDAQIGSSVNANARIGGSDRLVDVNVGIGGGNGGSNGNNPGNNGANGNSGNGNGVANVGRGGGSSGSSSGAACIGNDPNAALNLFQSTTFNGWQRASNIEIVPLQLCASDRNRVAEVLSGQQNYGRLQSAVQGDSLISAALNRSSYGPERVLGVDRSGSKLIVYVY